jgi:hypothetical protein
MLKSIHIIYKKYTFHAYQSQSSIQRRSSCVADKFATRNAILEWVVSEKLHHTFIHKFNHQFSKVASYELE